MPYPHSKGSCPPLQKVCMMRISLFSFIFTCFDKNELPPFQSRTRLQTMGTSEVNNHIKCVHIPFRILPVKWRKLCFSQQTNKFAHFFTSLLVSGALVVHNLSRSRLPWESACIIINCILSTSLGDSSVYPNTSAQVFHI